MQFKLILALVDDERSQRVVKAARDAGATGVTIITSARGEGLKQRKTFFGLDLAGQCDVILIVAEQHLSRGILEALGEAGEFDRKAGTGIAVQIAIEDAVGLQAQIKAISKTIEDQL